MAPHFLPELMQALLPIALQPSVGLMQVEKGTVLFRQQQKPRQIFFVNHGEVVLQRTGAQGTAVVLQRIRQGFVAEASLSTEAYHCDAVMTVPGEVASLPISTLKNALETDMDFAGRWISMLSSEVRRLRAQCERMSLRGVRERLLHLIETEGTNGRLRVASGLKSLATELAISHEALYRILATLEKEGRVRREDGALLLVGSGGEPR